MIEKPAELSSLDNKQLPVVNSLFDALFNRSMGVKYTNVLPTATTVAEGELVVYDDGAGTKRLYVITSQKNLGYIALT